MRWADNVTKSCNNKYMLPKSVEKASLKNKKVFLRADLDVLVKNNLVIDETRLNAWFPTLEYLLKQNAYVVIAGHLGRPEGQDEKFTLFPVARWIEKKLKGRIQNEKLGEFDGWSITGSVSLLENLRFYKEEEESNENFSKKLANLAEIYVNDAFASSHRAHASIVGVAKFLPSFAGLRLLREVEELSKILDKPERPLTVLIGGAKMETKLPLVEKMHGFADYVCVGGELVEKDKILIRMAHEKADRIKSMLFIADLADNGKEITQYSTENFIQVINRSKTVVWNGPMGLIEEEEYSYETKKIAQAIVASGAYSIVGGGDTVAFLQKIGLAEKFGFISIGGGAMLEFLSGAKLPGLVALES